jgi:hypothetical protein
LLPSRLYNVKQIYKTPRDSIRQGKYTNGIVEPGNWRAEGMPDNSMLPLDNVGNNSYSNEAKRIRDEFEEFFVTPQGALAAQPPLVFYILLLINGCNSICLY